jgi:hypothetical protein
MQLPAATACQRLASPDVLLLLLLLPLLLYVLLT